MQMVRIFFCFLDCLMQFVFLLSEVFYMHILELAVRGQSNNSQAAGTLGSNGQEYDAAMHLASGQGGLPTPASLAEVMLSTRQILTDQAADSLSVCTNAITFLLLLFNLSDL